MGRYSNKYIPAIIKKSPSNINQIGWELRTLNNSGEFRYKNDQFELVYDDDSIIVISAGNLTINENYTVEASDSYTIEAGDTIILNSTNEVNITSNTNNVNITSVTNNIVLSAGGNDITWNGTRFVTDTESVAYLSDIPSNITTQGNTFNGASQLVQLDSSTRLPAVDGSQLTNLPVQGGTIQNVNESIQPTDEGVLAGNARAQNSVDLQTSRNDASQVASGTFSSLLGGNNNTASGSFSTTVAGTENVASGSGSATLGGSSNEAVGNYSATTGIGNTSNSYCELIIGSFSETVSGTAGSVVSTDPAFRIGAGANSGSRFDAFRVDKDGTIYAPTKVVIDSDGTMGDTTGIYFGSPSPPTSGCYINERASNILFIRGSDSVEIATSSTNVGIKVNSDGMQIMRGGGASALVKNALPTNTGPTLIPNDLSVGSGVGGVSNEVSLICNYNEALRCTTTGIFAWNIKSGASEGASGAAVNELWIDTSDNSIKIRLV